MKSIYEEALEILVDSIQDPQDEDDDCYMLDLKQMNKLGKVIDQARKQEKLLEIYKGAYDNASAELLKMFNEEQDYKDTLLNITRHLDVLNIYKQLKELENNENI